MSKLNSTRSTGKSLCLPSQKEIDLWSNEGKRKATLYLKKQGISSAQGNRRSKITIDNEEQLQYAFNSSINQLRQKTRTQKSNSSTISNRMSYLQVDLKRKKQIKEIAKNKYQKMIEVRHKSFIEKRELNRERETFMRERQESVNLKASRIKSERKNSVVSTQLIRQKNQNDAMQIKHQRFRNEQLIAQRELAEKQKKRVMVERSHQYTDISREKMRHIEQSKFQQAKQTHNLKLLQEYMKGEMQRRKNTKLMTSFKSKVKQLQMETMNIQKEMSQYQKMLCWHYSNRSGKKAASSTSFYITR